MQAYKQLDNLNITQKNLRKEKIYFSKLKLFTNSKIRVLIDSRA